MGAFGSHNFRRFRECSIAINTQHSEPPGHATWEPASPPRGGTSVVYRGRLRIASKDSSSWLARSNSDVSADADILWLAGSSASNRASQCLQRTVRPKYSTLICRRRPQVGHSRKKKVALDMTWSPTARLPPKTCFPESLVYAIVNVISTIAEKYHTFPVGLSADVFPLPTTLSYPASRPTCRKPGDPQKETIPYDGKIGGIRQKTSPPGCVIRIRHSRPASDGSLADIGWWDCRGHSGQCAPGAAESTKSAHTTGPAESRVVDHVLAIQEPT